MADKTDHDLLIELNIKMDTMGTQMSAHVVSAERLHGDQEARLRVLEQWKWRWAGALAVVLFVWNVASQVLAKAVTLPLGR